MKLIVKSAIVHKNIKLFKEIVKDYQRSEADYYSVFVNRKTGELLFVEEAHNGGSINLKKWKPICFFFRAPKGFEILEEETNKTLFQCSDLDPTALRMLAQMIEALNRIVEETAHPSNLKEVLKEIAAAELETVVPEEKGKDIVHDAWHSVDREGAEHLLEHKAVGTYLFRKDEYVTILEEQLSSRLRTPVKCLTLTFLGTHDKVSDLTLVCKDHLWYIYTDDPSLEDTPYSDIVSLIKSLEKELTEPLLFEEVVQE